MEDQRLVAGVKEANRSKQKLSAYPSDLSKYRELERVDLSWNFIKVGAWTRPSHSRWRLIITSQCPRPDSSLPDTPRPFPNRVQTIPNYHCSGLNFLKELLIPFNKLEKLPESFGNLRELRILDIQGNAVSYLPESFVLLPKLEVFFAAKNDFRQFPRELKSMEFLHTLDLGYNKIVRVGRTIGTLKNLQHFSITHNEVKELPAELGRCKYLQTVDLSYNELTELPKEMGRCEQIMFLDASHNLLRTLPYQICECQVLQHLDCSHNKLVDIPQQYCYIRTLRRLNLSDNKISALHGPIHFWVNLQALDVSNNCLMVLPLEFSQLPLLDLYMHGNPELRIPEKALEGGTTSLLCYLGTIGAQHRMMSDYVDGLIFADSKKDQQDDDGEEMGRLLAAEHVGQAAIVPSTSQGDRSEMHEQVRQTREWLEADPRRARLAMTMKQKQKQMRKEVEQTRRFLASKNMDVGNPQVLLMERARYTGILNLKHTNLKSVPPEVKDLKDLKVADFRMNSLASLDEHILEHEALTVLDASHNRVAHLASGSSLPSLKVLCLAFNELKQLPADLPRKAPGVEVLYLSGNYLSSLPETFAELECKDLYVSENSFAAVPPPILEMTQITKLSLSCNRLKFIPPQISALVNLQFLDISFNDISELPKQFGELPNLERLNAGFNPLGPELPACLSTLPKLSELNLDFSNIRNLPLCFGEMAVLSELQLEGNALEHPFDAIYKKSPLLLVDFFNTETETLDLSDCGIEEIPSEIGRLQRLYSLDLSDNDIKVVSQAVGQLYNLVTFSLEGNPLEPPFNQVRRQPYGDLAIVAFLDSQAVELDLAGCSFMDLPESLTTHSRELRALNLSDNILHTLPEWSTGFQNLTSLVLDNNRFREFPEEVCLLRSLEVLSISKTEISDISPQIVDLDRLKKLALDSNDIRELPKCLVLMKTLEVLQVSNNKIEELPLSIGNLTNLHVLDVSCNDIEHLPPSLGDLSRLEVLDAKINQLREVPEEIGECDQLRHLNLSNNAIVELPKRFGRLKDLVALKLAANQLRRLPFELLDLEFLEEVQLYGNPFPNVPSGLNAKGTESCRFLMQALQKVLYPKGDPDATEGSSNNNSGGGAGPAAQLLQNVSNNLTAGSLGGDQPKARRTLDMDAAMEGSPAAAATT